MPGRKACMMQREVQMIVAAISAAGIAGGGAITAAVVATKAAPTVDVLWLAIGLAVVALCKDIQASLSEPPQTVHDKTRQKGKPCESST